MDENSVVGDDEMCDLVLNEEANNSGLMMDMAFNHGDDPVSDEAINEWVAETGGDVGSAVESEPPATVTETATPEPAPTVTVTAEAEATDAAVDDAGWDSFADAFYGMSDGEQDALCGYWQTDAEGAIDQFTADESMPVSEEVFTDWATFTCAEP